MPPTSPRTDARKLLENGEAFSQPEFHRLYEQHPGTAKIELVGGVVHVPSPLSLDHARSNNVLGLAVALYAAWTPGIEALVNASIILGEASEPQPDLTLRVLPEFGGQSSECEGDTGKRYLKGPPELLAEIAVSSRSIDLHQKQKDYRFAGVLEYVVVCPEEKELYWFSFKGRRPIKPDAEGIYRSRVFPGLWIDGPALLALDSAQVEAAVRRGLASKEHATFVGRLRSSRR